MKLSHKQVKHIAWLARLGLDESEVDKFSYQLSNILKNFEVLQQLDTSGVLPTTQSASLSNVFREDKASESLSKTDVLLNAPRQKEDCFDVQAILE